MVTVLSLITTGYGVDGPVSIPGMEIYIFSLHHSVQTDSEVHPAIYPMGTGG
jgi:hypothetical protein